jgi:hypothetical protein
MRNKFPYDDPAITASFKINDFESFVSELSQSSILPTIISFTREEYKKSIAYLQIAAIIYRKQAKEGSLCG